MNLTLRIWRQKNSDTPGQFVEYKAQAVGIAVELRSVRHIPRLLGTAVGVQSAPVAGAVRARDQGALAVQKPFDAPFLFSGDGIEERGDGGPVLVHEGDEGTELLRVQVVPGRGFVESEVLVFLPNFVAKAKGLCVMQSSPRPGTQAKRVVARR
jgi:hypothetical protein